MLKKRIIPCLDVQNGRTVKGVNFVDIRDAGDPIALAARYARQGADELVFLDITATVERRKTAAAIAARVAAEINIPFTVGGGISSLDDAKAIIGAGADKISVNSSALGNPQLIGNIAAEFGSQCVVLAADIKFVNGQWLVFSHGGRIDTERRAADWVREAYERGAGEILLTSMNNDGSRTGFALDITAAVASAVPIPVIASGGAGKTEDFEELFIKTQASAALAAGIFHDDAVQIADVKQHLRQKGIAVRIAETLYERNI